MKTLIYKVSLVVETVTGDPREYNQQRQVYKPFGVCIVVELEINQENFVLAPKFFEQLKLAELGQGEWPKVPEGLDFTPLGWSRVMEKLEAPYVSVKPSETWDEENNSEFSKEY
jgi:hypothetical protein